MLWPTMLRHWKLWPFVHSFNFYFVPLHHRMMVQNLALVGWSGYLSHLNSGGSGLLTLKEEIETTDARPH
jgi:protein Mpv17